MSEKKTKKEKTGEISRRTFIKGAGLAIGGTVIGSSLLANACSPAKNWWLPDKWDAEYDLVVIGFGGAGASTSITAADKGAKVLILEKGIEKEAGGNTGVCGGEAYSHQDIPSAIQYLTAMCDDYKLAPDHIEFWAEKMKDNGNFMTNVLECKTTTWRPWEEFPELPGSKNSGCWIVGVKPDSGWGHNLWDLYKAAALKRKNNIDIWYESPGEKLIQNPETKEILGVVATRGTKKVNIKARKAVALCCGGFQNNPRMIQDYLHLPIGYPKGTPNATGDGITMALEIGADLWHMNNVAGPDFNLKVPDLKMSFGYSLGLGRRNCIYVGRAGTRFWDESQASRHGKILQSGTWIPTPMPLPVHAVFDSTAMKAAAIYSDSGTMSWWTVKKEYPWSKDNSTELAKGWIKRADTIKALAGMIGKDADTLEATVKKYNDYCTAGVDPEFGRPKANLLAVSTPPYYAMELSCTFTNTQGGPRRNKYCQVLDTKGNPIPRLYSNGELGSMYSHCYNGGGNIGEAMAFGRVLGEHAVGLQPWV
jgi:succinate dehydrogenase/fumarate reductase flavoprotein subunit